MRKILRPVEIIKVYETTHIDPFGTEARTTDAVTCRKDNCRNIEIMDEPEVGEGYVVTGWRESKDRITPKNWKEVEPTSFIRKGSGSRSITATTQTKTLYVHLEHVNSEKLEQTELILRESEITRAFETPAVKDWGYKPMGFHWDSFSGTCSVGIGCTCDPCECVGEDGMGSCDCNDTCDTPYTVTDGAYNLLVKSAASNNKVIPSIKPFKALENYGSYHSGTIG